MRIASINSATPNFGANLGDLERVSKQANCTTMRYYSDELLKKLNKMQTYMYKKNIPQYDIKLNGRNRVPEELKKYKFTGQMTFDDYITRHQGTFKYLKEELANVNAKNPSVIEIGNKQQDSDMLQKLKDDIKKLSKK